MARPRPPLLPRSLIYLELFKVKNNAIRRVRLVFASMPYYMPSAW